MKKVASIVRIIVLLLKLFFAQTFMTGGSFNFTFSQKSECHHRSRSQFSLCNSHDDVMLKMSERFGNEMA